MVSGLMRVSLRGAGLLILVAGFLLFALFYLSPFFYVLGTLPGYIMMGVGLLLVVFGKRSVSAAKSRTLRSILSLLGLAVVDFGVFYCLPQYSIWAVVGTAALLALYHPWWQPKRAKTMWELEVERLAKEYHPTPRFLAAGFGSWTRCSRCGRQAIDVYQDEPVCWECSDRFDVARPPKSKSWKEWLSQPIGAKKAAEATQTSQPEEPPKREAMPTKFCRYCRATIPRVSKFCEECGASTSVAVPETVLATKTTESRRQAEITRSEKKQATSRGVRKATVGLVIICLVLLWAMLPVLIFFRNPDLDRFLTLTVSGGPCPTCHIESYFTLVLRNNGPWPMSIRHGRWDFLGVEWTGSRPGGEFTLMPFGAYTYAFIISSMGGPAGSVHVRFTAEATMLFITDYNVLITNW
jgi:hypothetical protein